MEYEQDKSKQLLSAYTEVGDSEYVPSSRASINEDDARGVTGLPLGQRVLRALRENKKVLLYALGLLISSTGNSILFKKMTNAMPNYPFFLSNLTTFIYLPIFGVIVAYTLKYTTVITPEMMAFPKRRYLVMGLWDALSGICMLFGGLHTSGSFQALLLNSVIPFTMILSILVLRTRYEKTQYAGAAVILAGVAVVLVPQMVTGNNADNNPLFNIIFLLSTVPQAVSSIYKELAFGSIELDVNLMQFGVAVFQFFIGLALIPLNSLPFLQDAYIPFKDLPSAISDGAKCFVGVNSRVNHTVFEADGSAHASCWLDKANKWGAPSDARCDDCGGAWLPVCGYIVFNCAYNLFIMLVIKHGSAALLWITLTLRLPLVQIAFAISAINNPPDSFHATSIVGLFVILGGLILYRWASVTGASAKKEEQDQLGAQIEGEQAMIETDLQEPLTNL